MSEFRDTHALHADTCDYCNYDSIDIKIIDTEWGDVRVCSDYLCIKEFNRQINDFN